LNVLDCSSVESAWTSLSRILGVSRSTLDDRLEAHRQSHGKDTLILGRELLGRFEVVNEHARPCAPFATRYFHATRTLASEDAFRSVGLLPLHEIIDTIWSQLFALLDGRVSEVEWRHFRSRIPSGLYHMKIQDRRSGGPYGFLIREAALLAPSPSRDYLRCAPEIVEDISLAFHNETGITLLERFLMTSKACLVWFDGPHDPRTLAPALEYVYAKRYNLELDGHQWSFDGQGQAVLPERIVRVEQVSNAMRRTFKPC
jgi:hypothetical protein